MKERNFKYIEHDHPLIHEINEILMSIGNENAFQTELLERLEFSIIRKAQLQDKLDDLNKKMHVSEADSIVRGGYDRTPEGGLCLSWFDAIDDDRTDEDLEIDKRHAFVKQLDPDYDDISSSEFRITNPLDRSEQIKIIFDDVNIRFLDEFDRPIKDDPAHILAWKKVNPADPFDRCFIVDAEK